MENDSPAPTEESHSDPQNDTAMGELEGVGGKRHLPTLQQRIKFFLTGVIFPIVCVFCPAVLGVTAHVDSPWQSGEFKDYAAVLVDWPSLGPMLPFMTACMVCMSAFVFRPNSARHPVVRGGLMAGVVLSLQYLILIMLTTGIVSLIAAVFVAPCLALIVLIAVRMRHWIKRFTILHVMILTAVVAILITLAIALNLKEMGATEVLVSMALTIVAAAPTLNFVTYARATIKATAYHQSGQYSKQTVIATVAGWVIAWLVSWRVTIYVMMIEYSKLPVTDPNCYVSSAAANGHPRIVKSVRTPAGHVNLQMQRLKFLEFAFAAAFPNTHRRVRRVYNRIGPQLAGFCARSVWFSDTTFLALKPLEYLAVTLQFLAKIPSAAIQRIYR